MHVPIFIFAFFALLGLAQLNAKFNPNLQAMEFVHNGPVMVWDEATGQYLSPATGGVLPPKTAAGYFRGMLDGLVGIFGLLLLIHSVAVFFRKFSFKHTETIDYYPIRDIITYN